MIDSGQVELRVKESLVGFPASTIAAYREYGSEGKEEDLDAVVLGVLQFYLAKKPGTPLESLPGSTRLIEDLGCDSLTMMDTVFMTETLFDVKIDDTELAQLATLDDLKGLFRVPS
jgi:acyl carrier protein